MLAARLAALNIVGEGVKIAVDTSRFSGPQRPHQENISTPTLEFLKQIRSFALQF